jgi:hypothetical protein
MHRVSSSHRLSPVAVRGERPLFRRGLHGRPGRCAGRTGQVGRNSRSRSAHYAEDWRRGEPCKEVRETNMNDVMVVILFILGSVGLVVVLRAWARSRHREITIADRLLANLLTAGHPPARGGGKPCSGLSFSLSSWSSFCSSSFCSGSSNASKACEQRRMRPADASFSTATRPR